MPQPLSAEESAANHDDEPAVQACPLLARICAQLKQHEQSEDALFTIAPCTFKPASKLPIDCSSGKISSHHTKANNFIS